MKLTLGWNLQTANLLMGLALIVLAGFAMLEALAPLASQKVVERTMDRRIAKARIDADTARKRMTEMEGARSVRLYEGERDDMMPVVLGQISGIARENGLSVESFRPQRVVEEAGLERVTYSLTVKGSFPKVASFIQAVDRTQGRLAVTQYQVSSTDSRTDGVTMTMGISAFRKGAAQAVAAPAANPGGRR